MFNVYLKNGKDGKGNKKVEVFYDKLGEYGIKATPAHGSKLPEVGTNFTVNFRSEESLINIPLRLQVQKAYKYCYATHVIVTYENGETQKIDLTEQDFSYTLKANAEVTKMEIYIFFVTLAISGISIAVLRMVFECVTLDRYADVNRIFFPQIMGDGYDYIAKALDGNTLLWRMAALVVLKSVATAITLGSGGAGGVFAPALFIGAVLGGSFGIVVHSHMSHMF